MRPTRNVTMRNLRIVSRNWCIGSATFGGIYDILFEDSTIGDPDTVRTVWQSMAVLRDVFGSKHTQRERCTRLHRIVR